LEEPQRVTERERLLRESLDIASSYSSSLITGSTLLSKKEAGEEEAVLGTSQLVELEVLQVADESSFLDRANRTDLIIGDAFSPISAFNGPLLKRRV
jgi:hypothetical protein